MNMPKGKKFLKGPTKEELNAEYYKLAASAGDIGMRIQDMQRQRRNMHANMSVILKRIQHARSGLKDAAKIDPAETPPSDPGTDKTDITPAVMDDYNGGDDGEARDGEAEVQGELDAGGDADGD